MSAENLVLGEFIPPYVAKQEGLQRIDTAYPPIQWKLKDISVSKDVAIKSAEAITLATLAGLSIANPVQAKEGSKAIQDLKNGIPDETLKIGVGIGLAVIMGVKEALEARKQGIPLDGKEIAQLGGNVLFGFGTGYFGTHIGIQAKEMIDTNNYNNLKDLFAVPAFSLSSWTIIKLTDIKSWIRSKKQERINNLQEQASEVTLEHLLSKEKSSRFSVRHQAQRQLKDEGYKKDRKGWYQDEGNIRTYIKLDDDKKLIHDTWEITRKGPLSKIFGKG